MIQYLCPKCSMPMMGVSTASIPPISRYQCLFCGYKSKPQVALVQTEVLPEELRSEESEETE